MAQGGGGKGAHGALEADEAGEDAEARRGLAALGRAVGAALRAHLPAAVVAESAVAAANTAAAGNALEVAAVALAHRALARRAGRKLRLAHHAIRVRAAATTLAGTQACTKSITGHMRRHI